MVKEVEQPSQTSEPVEKLSSVSDPTQICSLSHLVYAVKHPSEKCALSRIEIGPLNTPILFLAVGGARCNNLSFTSEGLSMRAPYH